jgi:hypothetical protein
MELRVSLTRREWMVAIGVLLLALLAAYFFTPIFRGHAVEVSLENAGPSDIFSHIDNTGRHGPGTNTVALRTTSDVLTPPGELVRSGQSRSFGMAVGLLDSPTLHIWRVVREGVVEAEPFKDCPFDTVRLAKLQMPSFHVKMIWTGRECLVVE